MGARWPGPPSPRRVGGVACTAMPHRVCPSCGDIVGRTCPRCAALEQKRRAAHPRRKVYNSAAWRALRQRVFTRDGGCRHRHLGPCLGRLVAHHLDGATGSDPLNEDRVIALCQRHSGIVDGARGGRVARRPMRPLHKKRTGYTA